MGYLNVWVTTSGRTPVEAGDNALENLDLMRATWNLCLAQAWRLSFGSRNPVNRILMGPVQTLHRRTGAPAFDGWWYEPNFRPSTRLPNLEQQIPSLHARQKWILKRARRFDGYLQSILVRYCKALDLPEWQSSFLQLWSILEALTGNPDSQKAIIARACGLYGRDKDYAAQQLRVLGRMRNEHIHAGVEVEDAEQPLYQLKGYVEQLIWFHLGTRYPFERFEDACEFLALPGTAVLEDRIRLYRYAKRFRSVPEEAED